MNAQQLKVVAQFRAVVGFVSARAIHSHVGDATAALADLRDQIEKIDVNAASRKEAAALAKAAHERSNMLRRALITNQLLPIVSIAELALGAKESLVLVRAFTGPRKGIGTERLIAAARKTAAATEYYRSMFLEYGLDPDFAAQLKAAGRDLTNELATHTSLGGTAKRRNVKAMRGLRPRPRARPCHQRDRRPGDNRQPCSARAVAKCKAGPGREH